ncbi:MAG TPA: hypothetical protein VFQ05_00920 [Candidatus Eisenbacteria bacterium]|nr:hypothetical protein [Candidatus Eisenbacteria bacterium]
MTVDIRLYLGFAGQAGRLAAVRQDVEELLRSVRGLQRFLLLETPEGLAIVLECEDGAACEACARLAERWMQERMPALSGYQPLAVTGEVIAEVGAPPIRELTDELPPS